VGTGDYAAEVDAVLAQKGFGEAVSKLPRLVINTHCHFDHIGGEAPPPHVGMYCHRILTHPAPDFPISPPRRHTGNASFGARDNCSIAASERDRDFTWSAARGFAMEASAAVNHLVAVNAPVAVNGTRYECSSSSGRFGSCAQACDG
jgi:glyoxylase-like metal-dependent hydrolase (beta-lactamase superfamily II)